MSSPFLIPLENLRERMSGYTGFCDRHIVDLADATASLPGRIGVSFGDMAIAGADPFKIAELVPLLDWKDIAVRRAVISGWVLPSLQRVAVLASDGRVENALSDLDYWCLESDVDLDATGIRLLEVIRNQAVTEATAPDCYLAFAVTETVAAANPAGGACRTSADRVVAALRYGCGAGTAACRRDRRDGVTGIWESHREAETMCQTADIVFGFPPRLVMAEG